MFEFTNMTSSWDALDEATKPQYYATGNTRILTGSQFLMSKV